MKRRSPFPNAPTLLRRDGRRPLRGTLALALALTADCASPRGPEVVTVAPASPSIPAGASSATPPAPPIAPSTPAASPPAPPVEQRRRYVGFHVGLEHDHHHARFGSRVRLPQELTHGRTSHFAGAIHLVHAERGPDLVVLLLDDGGVVVDSIELPGSAARYQFMAACSLPSGDLVPTALVPRDCKDGVTAVRAWNARAGKLEAITDEVTCSCFTDAE
ncbi:Hypothetical protein A7982_04510 [Minicystis rosea]|nr:Hypothetical protein A7982_04510 [Minicystis rosea]